MSNPLRISRVRVFAETAGASTFAKERSDSIGSFGDVQHTSAEMTKPHEMLANEAMVQRDFQTREQIPGAKSCELNLGVDLTPPGTALVDAVYGGSAPTTVGGHAANTFALGTILETVLGGYVTEEGSTEDGVASSTASAITVASAPEAARWVKGGVAGFMVGGVMEVRQIRDVAGAVLTPTVDLSAAPTDTSIVYNAHVFYLKRLGSLTKALQFIIEQGDRDDLWWLLGMQLQSMGLDLSLKSLAKATFSLKGADFAQDDAVGTPLGGSAIAAGTLTDGDPIPVIDGDVIFGTGSYPQTYASLDTQEISMTPGVAYGEIPSVGGVNGIKRFEMTIGPEMGVAQFTVPSDSGVIKTYEADKVARTKRSLSIQIGNTPSKTLFVALPRVQITDVQRAAAGENHGAQITVRWLENDADVTTDVGASPIVLAFL